VQRGGAPGTGLGLAIAKHLVDLKGGKIFFESDPTAKPGTTCIVEMPLDRCEKPETVEVVETQQESESSVIQDEISFLIIDDIRMNRTMFRRRFTSFIAPNAQITEASTGEEALVICNERKFDVILVDQHMEEAGGVLLGTDTVVAMRRRKIDSVIVGCSGNDIDGQFMEAGMDWVMKKPTPKNDVIAKKLRQLLARRQRLCQQSDTPSPVTDVPNSEVAKRRLGLSICPNLGPPRPHFKKPKIL
jgi:CheY-like chemotaxis protein